MKQQITATLGLLVAAFFAAGCQASTFVPVQLLNPVGSTAGQAVVSTGPSTPPAWGNVTATALTAQAANTVVANVTAASASPTAISLPSCSTANSALKYATSTGFSCGTTYGLTSGTLAQFAATTSAQLASVVSDETGSGSLVFGTAPTINQPNIVGVTTNTAAAAGSVGETTGNQTNTTSMTSGTPLNCTSKLLGPGIWMVSGSVVFNPQPTTTISLIAAAISTTSASLGVTGSTSQLIATFTTGQPQYLSTPSVIESFATSTTVYVVGNATFGASTMTCNGFIVAVRIH